MLFINFGIKNEFDQCRMIIWPSLKLQKFVIFRLKYKKIPNCLHILQAQNKNLKEYFCNNKIFCSAMFKAMHKKPFNRIKVRYLSARITQKRRTKRLVILSHCHRPSIGQLISKCLFEVFVWTKIPTKILIISALKGPGQKLSKFSLVF